MLFFVFFFKQKTAYEMRISDWSSDVCSSDLSAKGLRHVGVVHGTKAYATHLAKDPPVPMRESLPRPPHDDFYFRQEDALWDRAQKHGFDWTVFRAPTIAGGGRDSNLNGLLAIAIIAVLRDRKSTSLNSSH